MFWRESFLRCYWSAEAASRKVIGGSHRKRCGHWLDASSERNIRHSNRPRDIIVVVQELQDSVVPGRPEYTAACHWSSGAGRGAAGQASRRLTMPPTLTSRPSWAVRVRRFSLGQRSVSGRGMLGQTKGEAVRGRRSERQDSRLPRLASTWAGTVSSATVGCGSRGDIPPGRTGRQTSGWATPFCYGHRHGDSPSEDTTVSHDQIIFPNEDDLRPARPNGYNKHIIDWLTVNITRIHNMLWSSIIRSFRVKFCLPYPPLLGPIIYLPLSATHGM